MSNMTDCNANSYVVIRKYTVIVSGVSRVCPGQPLEGGCHSAGLFLKYATRLTFLTV